MLSRRLQPLLSVRERAVLLRMNFAGSHVQFNPRLHQRTSINKKKISIKTLVPVYTTRQWLGENVKRDEIISRACHTSTDGIVTMEQHSESNYARSVLVNSNKNLKSIGAPLETIEDVTDEEAKSILAEDWNAASAEAVLEAFRKLSCHAKITSASLNNEEHECIISALTAKLSELSDEQLRRICQCCLLWEGIRENKTSAYINLYQKMDTEWIQRLNNWMPDDAFLMCDYAYQLKLFRKLKYSMMVLKKFGNKPNRMTTANMLYFVFMLSIYRKPPINMYEIEYRVDKILEEFTANELGVVAMGFFKTQTSFRDQKIVSRIQVKVLEAIDTIHDISLTAIMKMTRYSTGLKDLKLLAKIFNTIKPRVSQLSIPCLAHLLHAGAVVQLYNAELLQLIIQRFEMDIDDARLKDLERFTFALSIYNYDSKSPVYEKIINCLRDPRRAEELQLYASMLPTIMLHLSNVEVFPLDLIKQYLEPAFLEKLYKNNIYKIGWDFFAMESNLRIEQPQYEGPFLPNAIRNYLATKYLIRLIAEKSLKVHPSDKMVLELVQMCKVSLKSETAVHVDHILPHFTKPDIIICLDEKNNPVAPEPILSKIPQGTTKRLPPEVSNLKWIAIVAATQNQMIKETDRYIGPLVTKLRQLRKFGYNPIVVTHIQWKALKTVQSKEDYIRNLLPSADRKISAEAV